MTLTPTPAAEDTRTYTLIELATALGITRRGAGDLLKQYSTAFPARVRVTHRGVLLIPAADYHAIIHIHGLARRNALSFVSLLTLRHSRDAELWNFLGRSAERHATMTPPSSDLARIEQMFSDLQRNQAHLLRIISPLARTATDTESAVTPTPAPARVSSRLSSDDES